MKGQALVESLFTYLLIFLVSFCVIEVARLQAFKALLQISVNYYAKYLALDEIKLIREYGFDLNSKKKFSNKKIENDLTQLIAHDLGIMSTSLFSFDDHVKKLFKHNVFVSVDLISHHTLKSPPGIHIKAQTCLPVLFSSFFDSFLSKQKTNIGRSINDLARERNCLGEFVHMNTKNTNPRHQTPRFWFRVRAAGYSPWPSSTQIFYKGLGVPQNIKLLDSKQLEKFIKKFDEVNFDQKF